MTNGLKAGRDSYVLQEGEEEVLDNPATVGIQATFTGRHVEPSSQARGLIKKTVHGPARQDGTPGGETRDVPWEESFVHTPRKCPKDPAGKRTYKLINPLKATVHTVHTRHEPFQEHLKD